MRKTLTTVLVCVATACGSAESASSAGRSPSPSASGSDQQAPHETTQGGGTTPAPETISMKIRLMIEGETLTATLTDSAATRDFVALLPLDLTLRDYAGTEKVSDLPSKLSTKGMPAGVDPDVGDITYYAPWGNLAIFYRDFGYSSGLVKLGRLDAGVEKLAARSTTFAVRIERIEAPR